MLEERGDLAGAREWHCVQYKQGMQQRKKGARTSNDPRDGRPSTLIMFNLMLTLVKFARPKEVVDCFIVLPSQRQSTSSEKGAKGGHTISKNWPSIV